MTRKLFLLATDAAQKWWNYYWQDAIASNLIYKNSAILIIKKVQEHEICAF
ncbi:hypothetical protein [Pseudanabaena sp. SR411]|uniref:hypothetical protein n=1 Tax=Pseudanabaena sp. SR411 TaxID=1980935 RepID=UPI00159545CC|nr:hypothetical protein [Pseudanabaena sp. SR411]